MRLGGIKNPDNRSSDKERDKERKRAQELSWEAATEAMVDQVDWLLKSKLNKPGDAGVYVVARSRAHQAQLKRMLLERKVVAARDLFVMGQVSVEHTEDSVLVRKSQSKSEMCVFDSFTHVCC